MRRVQLAVQLCSERMQISKHPPGVFGQFGVGDAVVEETALGLVWKGLHRHTAHENGPTSIMMTANEMVSRVTPPMKAPAPISANAPGSTHAQGLGVRNTPGGALHAAKSSEVLSTLGPTRQTCTACRSIST